jgi:hypothetical protein
VIDEATIRAEAIYAAGGRKHKEIFSDAFLRGLPEYVFGAGSAGKSRI